MISTAIVAMGVGISISRKMTRKNRTMSPQLNGRERSSSLHRTWMLIALTCLNHTKSENVMEMWNCGSVTTLPAEPMIPLFMAARLMVVMLLVVIMLMKKKTRHKNGSVGCGDCRWSISLWSTANR